MTNNFKTNFNFYTNFLLIGIIVFSGLVWADSNGIWHYASDVRGGIFGGDETDILGESFTFVNPLNIMDNATYKGVELDTRYVNENQPNSIKSSMIANGAVTSAGVLDGSLTYLDTNVNSIQRRITGSCPPGQSIRAISATGAVTCETDDTGDFSSCQICIQCNYDGMNLAGATRCVAVNGGWSGYSGDLTNNGAPSKDNAACRVMMSC